MRYSEIPELDDLRAEMRKLLKIMNIKAVARDSGVKAHSIYSFVRGANEPRYDTVKRLHTYLAKNAYLAQGDVQNG